MSIRELNNQEVQQVAGGALPTQFVALNTSFDSLVASGTAKLDIDQVAIRCCRVHCCHTHRGLDLGGLVNPVIR